MILDFKHLRPSVPGLIYPPYHQGRYIEEFFYDYYRLHRSAFDETGYTLIPVFWTNIYVTGANRHLIQPYVNALPSGRYFTVSQHDDAVSENMPPGTLRFEAGGNRDGIPIPLICSPLRSEHLSQKEKDIFCSFVGSNNTDMRNKLYKMFSSEPDIFFSNQQWRYDVQQDRFETFLDVTKRSHFTLCPRGYGAQSFRLYEAIQLNSIPVFIYDKKWFPFSDKINWDEFCVLVHVNELNDLMSILRNINTEQQQRMLIRGKEIYPEYFTLEKTCEHILSHLRSLR